MAPAGLEAREALQLLEMQRSQWEEYPETVTQTFARTWRGHCGPSREQARMLPSSLGDSARSRTIGTSAMLLRLWPRYGTLWRCKTCLVNHCCLSELQWAAVAPAYIGDGASLQRLADNKELGRRRRPGKGWKGGKRRSMTPPSLPLGLSATGWGM